MAEQHLHHQGRSIHATVAQRAKREAAPSKGMSIAVSEAGVSHTAATLQNCHDMIQDPILLILFSRQRNAKQVLACIHADDLIDNPAP